MKFFEKLRIILLKLILIIILSFFLLITILFSTIFIQKNSKEKINNQTLIYLNQTNDFHQSFSAFIFLFNLCLFFVYLFIHFVIYLKYSSIPYPSKTAFFREFLRIFDNGRHSSSNPLIEYILKICLLSILWYLSLYLMLRSMSILISSQIIISYSITITLREVLGWIFLHEQFIGNKIIGHILGLSGLLVLVHYDGLRLNRYLFGLAIIILSAVIKGIFDIILNGLIKDLTNWKLRIIMINICFCGTCLFWPCVLIFHLIGFEQIQPIHFCSLYFFITLLFALLYNVLLIIIPMEYRSTCHIASFLIVIPSIALINHYYFKMKCSSLIISSIICSCLGIIVTIIPKEWFRTGEGFKMKQAFGLLNKDSSGNTNIGGTTTSSSTFDQIRAQQRLKHALLYSESKT